MTTRFKNIEFLRIFACLMIVLLHFSQKKKMSIFYLFPQVPLFKELNHIFSQANMAVEIFFVISGFLFALKDFTNLKFTKFITRKYLRFFPMIIVSMAISFIGRLLHVFKFRFLENLPTLFLLNNFGVSIYPGTNGLLWYISVLMACFFIYFFVLKHTSKPYFWIGYALILSYGCLEFLRHGVYSRPLENIDGYLNVGFMRGIGAFGIGTLIGLFYKENLKSIDQSPLNMCWQTIFTIFEIVLGFLVLMWFVYPRQPINCFVFVLIFSLFFMLLILKKGYVSQVLEKDIWLNFSRYTYPIYVVHDLIFKIINMRVYKFHKAFVVNHPSICLLISLCVVLAISIASYHLVYKPMFRFFEGKLLKK